MLAFTVFITLCQSEVNDVNLIFRLVSSADKEVVRLDVSVDDSLLVHLLDPHQLNIYSQQVKTTKDKNLNSKLTICLAISRTVFRSNERLHD
jgi:hypothetical protein